MEKDFWPKCLDNYDTVHDFAIEVLKDYYGYFVAYGENSRTDVRVWWKETSTDPSCHCKKCKKSRIIHIGNFDDSSL